MAESILWRELASRNSSRRYDEQCCHNAIAPNAPHCQPDAEDAQTRGSLLDSVFSGLRGFAMMTVDLSGTLTAYAFGQYPLFSGSSISFL
jgi:hypothetical protein